MKSFISYTLSFSLIAFMVLLASCAKDKAIEPSDTIDTVGCMQPGQTITYYNDIQKILETNCTNEDFGPCHQSGTPNGPELDFSTYEGIKAKADDGTLIDRVITNQDMPSPATTGPQTLSDCDKSKIQTWVNQGALH